jgi:hypothetical protein
MLTVGDKLTVKENSFLEALFPESWILDKDSKIELDDKPNLMFIAHKGLKNFYEKSFYEY